MQKTPGLIPGSGRSPGEGNGNPLQYFCLGNPHGQRSLVGYSPWGHKVRHDGVTKHKESVKASLMVQMVKNPPQCSSPGFDPRVGQIPWRREWLPTPVFLPGKCHGQRSLVGYSPWGRRESDKTELLTYIHTHTQAHTKNLSGWS